MGSRPSRPPPSVADSSTTKSSTVSSAHENGSFSQAGGIPDGASAPNKAPPPLSTLSITSLPGIETMPASTPVSNAQPPLSHRTSQDSHSRSPPSLSPQHSVISAQQIDMSKDELPFPSSARTTLVNDSQSNNHLIPPQEKATQGPHHSTPTPTNTNTNTNTSNNTTAIPSTNTTTTTTSTVATTVTPNPTPNTATPNTSTSTSHSTPSVPPTSSTAPSSSLPPKVPHKAGATAAAAAAAAAASPPVKPSVEDPALELRRAQFSKRTSIAQYIDQQRRQQQEQQLMFNLKKQLSATGTTAGGTTTAPAVNKDSPIIMLPRGGTYVNTSAGPVQFGLPPETIKDSMKLGLVLPTMFVIPKERFNLQLGINVAEFEFPAYYNFFLKRRRIQLLTTREVEPLIKTIFRETLLGPTHIDPPVRYSDAIPQEAYPDLEKEMSFFRVNPFDKTPLTVETLLEFVYFEDNVCNLGNDVTITDEGEEYVVREGDREIARVMSDVILTPPDLPDDKEPVNNFVPPHFGITMLGNSDGFDAHGTTTGFVLWMNRRGIMIDPPPHSGALLRRQGISPRLMRGVILTHCHADHDAGTFQKILEEGRVVVMTTEVILNSFLTKYSAISGLDKAFLKKLFLFRPVTVGEKIAVYGGQLQFFYALHTIPCVGFNAFCNNKSMVYSADTFNDAKGIEKLFEQGLMSKGRRDALVNFPWHRDIILHEAGVPPIHTPLTTLTELPEDVKQRLYIVHKPSKDVPQDKGLKSALTGVENTIVISDKPGLDSSGLEILDLCATLELFSGIGIHRGIEMIQSAKKMFFQPGDVLIQEGTQGSTFYVIAMGTVGVYKEGAYLKALTVGDHFGEHSIASGEKRTASITALTSVEVLQFDRDDFLYIIRDSNILERIRQLGIMQKSKSWQTICSNSVLVNLTSSQKTYLQSIFHRREVAKGDVVWSVGNSPTMAILIDSGSFVFERASDLPPFRQGAFVGDMGALLNETPLTTSLICQEAGAIFSISRADLLKFFDDNPGFRVFFMNRRFVE